jgi:hypothetical protein
MRGDDQQNQTLFTPAVAERRILSGLPLRLTRQVTDAAVAAHLSVDSP